MSTLTALGHEKEMDSSYSSVMLEKKLSVRLKNEFSKSFTSEDSSDKNRMKSLLKFLQGEKKAAHLRTCNYSTTSPIKSDSQEDSSVSTNATGVGGDHGHGDGRGRGRGSGRGKDKNKSVGKNFRTKENKFNGNFQKRGEPNTKCLFCNGDHSTSKCSNLRDKNNVKAELLGLACSFPRPFCMWCIEPGHHARHCKSQEDKGCPCGSGFNIYLCCRTDDCKERKNWTETNSSMTTISSSLTQVNGVKMGETLLPIQMIPVTNKDVVIRVMFDNCSQSTFILTSTASKLGIKGTPITYILVCTDGTKKNMSGLLFKLKLKDIGGKYHEVEAVGLDKISSVYPGIKVTDIRTKVGKFSMCNSVTDVKLARTEGKLDLLIGSDLAHLHPKAVPDVRKLSLMRSNFGTSWTLMGQSRNKYR